jgi:hypothetical protein
VKQFAKTKRGLWVAALMLSPAAAQAGSVITANLPPRTAIVNIDARQDGALNYDGPQDKWYRPFSSLGAGSLLTYTIEPGVYRLIIINPTLAAQQFPALTTTQLNSMYTAWTYNSPWITNYMAWDIAAATNFSLQQILSGATGTAGFGNAQAAFDAAYANNYADELKLPPGGRLTGVPARRISFPSAQTLVFGIPDPGLFDNAGGVSVLISPIPMPADFDGDLDIDTADYLTLSTHLHTDVSMMTPEQAALAGDLTGDLKIDGRDFVDFRREYDEANGVGAFVAMLEVVPEPSSDILFVVAGVRLAARRRNSTSTI